MSAGIEHLGRAPVAEEWLTSASPKSHQLRECWSAYYKSLLPHYRGLLSETS